MVCPVARGHGRGVICFGHTGNVQAPVDFKVRDTDPSNLYFQLVRNKNEVLASMPAKHKTVPGDSLPYERNRRLGVGINLNGVADGNLHPGYECDAPISEDDILSIADVGFESVRFDICWAKHSLSQHPYTIEPEFFEKIDTVIGWCFRHNLAVSIDQHYYPVVNMWQPATANEYAENLTRLTSLWSQIACHYKDYPDDMLFFDLLNEPNNVLGADGWNSLIRTLLATIRRTNPGRTVMVQTPCLGQSWTLNLLQLPDEDRNVIVQFHYYLPHTFTHQGLEYAMAGDVANVEWKGTEAEKQAIVHDLDFCSRWSERTGRPLNMGEWGTVNTADMDSRARYHAFICEQNRRRGFSSHMWAYREPFMIRNDTTGLWNHDIIKAMFSDTLSQDRIPK